jgi:hypothetical protein
MRIAFTEYAVRRMSQRDILEEEVVEAIEATPSRHKLRADNRHEVRERFGRRTLLVVYARRRSQILVINAMWE